jgi:undecaprenyl diphosphate synthase
MINQLKDSINTDNLPRHIAIIMDGNGRWATQKGQPRVFGHKSGVKSVREASEGAAELGIEFLTLYAFSTENWGRPKMEVNALMSLLVETLKTEIETLNKNNIRLKTIGEIELMPDATYKALLDGIESTAHNTGMTLTLALNYSSRSELTKATKTIAEKVKNGELFAHDIDEDVIAQHLETAGIPDPDILIRTSGEFRLSNFILWQIAYTELIFTPVLWPDFTRKDLYHAIMDYQKRERRFGKINESIST